MHNISVKFSVFFLIIFTLISCSDDSDSDSGYYIRFKLNGTPIDFYSNYFEFGERPSAFQNYGSPNVNIMALISPTNRSNATTGITLLWTKPTTPPYSLTNGRMTLVHTEKFSGSNTHITVSEHGGPFETVRGKFEGIVKDGAGNTNYITEGRFRVFVLQQEGF